MIDNLNVEINMLHHTVIGISDSDKNGTITLHMDNGRSFTFGVVEGRIALKEAKEA